MNKYKFNEYKKKFINVLYEFEDIVERAEENMCSSCYNDGDDFLDDKIYYLLRQNNILCYIFIEIEDIVKCKCGQKH